MNILITGGAGYIGNALVSQLATIASVSSIVVYDNLSHNNTGFFFGADKLQHVRFIKGDILDAYKLEKAMQNADVVLHLAAHVVFPYNHLQNLQYEQINRWGSLAVVRAIEKTPSVKKVLYLSSAAVYGFGENIDRNASPTPANAYGISKLEAEKYFELLDDSHNLAIYRAANVFGYGINCRLDSVINSFYFDALISNKINIHGNGTQQRAFIYLPNLVTTMCNWILSEKEPVKKLEIDFTATLNQIKDVMISEISGLEYTYLNQNQNFLGQTFDLPFDESVRDVLLREALTDFKNNIRI